MKINVKDLEKKNIIKKDFRILSETNKKQSSFHEPREVFVFFLCSPLIPKALFFM